MFKDSAYIPGGKSGATVRRFPRFKHTSEPFCLAPKLCRNFWQVQKSMLYIHKCVDFPVYLEALTSSIMRGCTTYEHVP